MTTDADSITINHQPQAEKKWDTELYDNQHAFVSRYGRGLIDWLAPQAGETILDLGCGTGQLADEISKTGAIVTGMDSSADMIEKARRNYPHISFDIADATNFSYLTPFDAIFSNAALHWVTNAEAAVACMYQNLKTGGRLVLEMGGYRNIERIANAIKTAIASEGFSVENITSFWYFPSVSEYTTLLEQQGFSVTDVAYYKRDTPLEGEDGMSNWIQMFGTLFFKDMPAPTQSTIINKAVELLRNTNRANGQWYADYVRLKIRAIKAV